jgi:hypothetical protein
MKANLNPGVEIDERDRYYYILKAKRILLNPAQPTHPVIRDHMLVLKPADYIKYFKCPIEEQLRYLKNMNVEDAELVHDPKLEGEKPKVEVSAEAKLKAERVKSGRPRR